MKLLLDTHTFLWAIDQPSKLSRRAIAVLTRRDSQLFLSAASLWEVVVKFQTGKLRLPATPEYFETHLAHLGVKRVLDISPAHVLEVLQLPPLHRDPFDRLLVAQCAVERLSLVSADPALHAYPIEVIW